MAVLAHVDFDRSLLLPVHFGQDFWVPTSSFDGVSISLAIAAGAGSALSVRIENTSDSYCRRETNGLYPLDGHKSPIPLVIQIAPT